MISDMGKIIKDKNHIEEKFVRVRARLVSLATEYSML